MNSYKKIFRSSYILRILKGDLHPFTPNIIIVDENQVEFHRRNVHLISVDTEILHFQNITGVVVDKHIFGATIVFNSSGSEPTVVYGFPKRIADEIRSICAQFIAKHSQRGASESIASAFSKQQHFKQNTSSKSIVEELSELKSLLDNGAITQQEYNTIKLKIIEG